MTPNHLTVKLIHSIHRGLNNFKGIMQLKLMENAHKGTWDTCTYQYLRDRLSEELKEVDEKISEGDYLDAREELADVANFCMMISDNISYGRFGNYDYVRPYQSERDKVLDEIIKKIPSLATGQKGSTACIEKVTEMIEELQKAGE
jgi:hypothetical protein